MGTESEEMADARWVMTRKEVDGVKTAKVRLVAKGYQDLDLRNSDAEIAGCVSRRSSHLQLISLGALKTWSIWSVDFKNPFLQEDGFGREVFLRTPRERNSKNDRRVWRMRALAYGHYGVPVSSHQSLR